MSDIAARVRLARIEAKYRNATKAAQAFGWVVPTYLGYENGDRVPSREAAIRIAKAFGVRLDWLLTGRGEMRPGKPAPRQDDFDIAKAYSRAPAGVQRIVERILTDAGSMTDEEKRSLASPDVVYTQEESAPQLNLQDPEPERPSGLPIDKTGLDQRAIDAARARQAKLKPKPTRR